MPVRMPVAKEGVQGRKPADPLLRAPEDPSLTPDMVYVPDAPTETDDQQLRDEQQVARVEILMAKGVRDRRQLMTLLEVTDPRQMDRYIKRVYARWELLGSNREFARHRGEGLHRLDMIEQETWSKLSNTEDERVALVALKTLTDIQNQRMQLLGLSPKVIERLTTQGNDNISFAKRISTHDKLSRVAARMLEIMEERTGPRRARPASPEGEISFETLPAA